MSLGIDERPQRRPDSPELWLHLPQPNYTRPLLEISAGQRKRLLDPLIALYGRERAQACFGELERIMRVYYAHRSLEMIRADQAFNPADRFSEQDVILITYGDLLTHPNKKPLRVLTDFLGVFMHGAINTVHLLPFSPYSSDRGFSIIDYQEVDPQLGTWEEIEEMSLSFRFMFDGVFNHVSSKSRWFQEFLNGNPYFQDFFIHYPNLESISDEERKLIFRPRTSDLLTAYNTINGPAYLWTTFSPDQIDLNFKSEKVLLKVVQILLYYLWRGADLIRLDAVTYLWVELGTSCALLDQTHLLVQLYRAVLDVVAPRPALVTESNVPHQENLRYFGDGSGEAQMIYNFALPPLVLHAFHTGDCTRLADWAAELDPVSETATYFNFLDSHDGVGLLPVRDILNADEIALLVQRTLAHGGVISHRDLGEGSESPYELNITWFSALNRPDAGESMALQVNRFIASRAIALVLMGVPGIYLPSLFGSVNDQEAVFASGERRSINRRSIEEKSLFRALSDPQSTAHLIAEGYGGLLKTRIQTPAFHPNAAQRILRGEPAVLAVWRSSPDKTQTVLALTNVSAGRKPASYPLEELGAAASVWQDLLTGRRFEAKGDALSLELKPYQVVWLTPVG